MWVELDKGTNALCVQRSRANVPHVCTPHPLKNEINPRGSR